MSINMRKFSGAVIDWEQQPAYQPVGEPWVSHIGQACQLEVAETTEGYHWTRVVERHTGLELPNLKDSYVLDDSWNPPRLLPRIRSEHELIISPGYLLKGCDQNYQAVGLQNKPSGNLLAMTLRLGWQKGEFSLAATTASADNAAKWLGVEIEPRDPLNFGRLTIQPDGVQEHNARFSVDAEGQLQPSSSCSPNLCARYMLEIYGVDYSQVRLNLPATAQNIYRHASSGIAAETTLILS